MAKGDRLTDRQEKFCNEYLKDLNATQAVIRAGYAKAGATVTGSQLLVNPKVVKRLAVLRRKMAEADDTLNATELLAQIRDIATYDPADLYDEDGNLKNIHDIPKHARMAIESFEVITHSGGEGGDKTLATKKIKLTSKPKAIDMGMRHLGLYEKHEKQKGNELAIILDRIANGGKGHSDLVTEGD